MGYNGNMELYFIVMYTSIDPGGLSTEKTTCFGATISKLLAIIEFGDQKMLY